MNRLTKIIVLMAATAAVTSVGCRGGWNGACGNCGALNYPSQYNYGAAAGTYAPQAPVIQQPGFQTVQPGFQQVQTRHQPGSVARQLAKVRPDRAFFYDRWVAR